VSSVYFIKSMRSKAVKIGVSVNVAERLVRLQTGSVARLILLAEMPGEASYERALHKAFAEYRIAGEWFRCEGKLAAFIASLPRWTSASIAREQPQQRPKRQQRLPDVTGDATKSYVDDRDLAQLTPISRSQWQAWRHKRMGPPFRRVGRRCVYVWSEVKLWLETKGHEA